MENKLECMLVCIQKPYEFVSGNCASDSTDSLSNHELLFPGHLILGFFKEKISESMDAIAKGLEKEMQL